MNIVLVGYRCSGKSVVGKILADYLGYELVDTDQVLERRAGSPICDYVAENGWEAFRMLEKMIIRSTSNLEQRVIATGGGAVLDWENVRNLKKTGWVVWLETSIPVIRKRMMQDQRSGFVRPGLSEKNPMSEIEQVLGQRTALYERACDHVVNGDLQPPERVAQEILQSLPETVIPVQDNGQPQGMVRAAAPNP